jgi:hypothetical protein
MKLRSGNIPTEVIYTFGPSRKVAQKWEGIYQPSNSLEFTEVTPVLVSDASDLKTTSQNRQLVESRCFSHDPNTGENTRTATTQAVEIENAPMKELQVIVNSFVGDRTGFYVRTPEGYFFDIANDVLLDTISAVGIQPGGYLPGEYIWATVEGIIKIVRVGSSLFESVMEANERHVLTTLPKKGLQVGCIYESQTGSRGIFLGSVVTESWELVWPTKDRRFNKPSLAIKPRRSTLWFEVSNWSVNDKTTGPMVSLFNTALSEPLLSTSFKLKTSNKVVRSIDSTPVPEDVVEQVRVKAVRLYQQRFAEKKRSLEIQAENFKNHLFRINGGREPSPYELLSVIANAAACCLMHLPNEPTPKADENFEKLAQFSGKGIEV